MQKTNFAFEALIHDDASTDNSKSIIREYAEKYPDIIKPIYQKENLYSKGVDFYRTEIYPRAKGKYIAMCEGDDYWIDPYKLQKQVDFMESNPDYSLVYTAAKVFNDSTSEFLNYNVGEPNNKLEEIVIKNSVVTLTILYPKCYISEYLNFRDEIDKTWLMGDYPLLLFIATKGKLKFIDELTAVYRILENSVSHRNDLKEQLDFINSSYDVSLFYINHFDINVAKSKLNRYYDLIISSTYFSFGNYKGVIKQCFYSRKMTFKERLNNAMMLFYCVICKLFKIQNKREI